MSPRSSPAVALSGVAYGGDRPALVPRETWVEDVRLMRAAQVDLVSVKAVTRKLELAPGDVAVIREEDG